VIVEGDVKLRHLRRDPRCILVVFEAVPPFRGVEARGVAELVEDDVTDTRADCARRYLGPAASDRFVRERASTAGVLVRLRVDDPRVWDLSAILST
jgi:hypothetical protein